MKKMISIFLVCLFWMGTAQAASSVNSFRLSVDEQTVSYAFSTVDMPYVIIEYSTGIEKGRFTQYAADCDFSGEFTLACTYRGKVTVKVLNYQLRELASVSGTLAATAPTAPPRLGTESKAARKTVDLMASPIDGGVHYYFAAPGHETVYLKYSSSQQSGTLQLYPVAGYVYEGDIWLPCTYADSNVTLTVQNSQKSDSLGEVTTQKGYTLPAAVEQAEEGRLTGVTVCIDPGHQGISKQVSEPVGPGLSGKTSGTYGMAQGGTTRRKESIVVLEIAYKLRDELLRQGATVIMTRDVQDTWVSNLDRCAIAYEGGADFMLRLHCDTVENTNKKGIYVYGPLNSDYAKAVAPSSEYKALGTAFLDATKAAVGYKLETTTGYVLLNDNFVGNNWAQMPCFLVEMGFMSNVSEDLMLSTPQYQQFLAEGMADGVYDMALMRGILQ